MDGISQQFTWLINSLQTNFFLVISMLCLLWCIQIINFLLQYRLNHLGLLPRTASGLIGIITSPFLHGNFSHLFFNSIPLFVLISFIMLDGLPAFISVTIVITLLSGAAVWCFGRKAIHVGASGLLMGYWGYLILNAFAHPSVVTVLLIVVCLFYFGGFLASLFPEEGTSWEGHVFGLLAGLATSHYHLASDVLPFVIKMLPPTLAG
jgi:membrane associated rhomboid family serine protease